MTSVPHSLFKYFSSKRLDVLRNLTVRYTPLGAFNDPFEGRPEILALASPERMEEIIREVRPQIIREAYAKQLPRHVQADLSYAQFEQQVLKQIDGNPSASSAIFAPYVAPLRELMSRTFDKSLGAFCLSEVPDSLLMWSHYGDSHAGFAIEFDAQHQYFDQRRSEVDEFRHLRQVEYRQARPSANFSDLSAVDVFCVKSEHWSYEREWRIFRALGDADITTAGEPYPNHLYHFPAGALRSVILGARATQETIESVQEILSGNRELGHVRLRRASVDGSQFLLRIED
ncbi:DUF2971 domain-containing protein [Paraburkholderia tropica]|uniref:DUF2971 domain-containing protein n=1 Tax=Paraburkholderia tropica TaxID=92647 RepID=UPI002ABDDAFA|nr:DUF2971 domain-containing protein [Paraburkholderia tropica]